jgi:hypothetical protein
MRISTLEVLVIGGGFIAKNSGWQEANIESEGLAAPALWALSAVRNAVRRSAPDRSNLRAPEFLAQRLSNSYIDGVARGGIGDRRLNHTVLLSLSRC